MTEPLKEWSTAGLLSGVSEGGAPERALQMKLPTPSTTKIAA